MPGWPLSVRVLCATEISSANSNIHKNSPVDEDLLSDGIGRGKGDESARLRLPVEGSRSVSIDTVSVDTQSTEKLTSVCSNGSAASSFSNTSHRGAFPGGGLSVHQGSFLIMNLCQFWSFA